MTTTADLAFLKARLITLVDAAVGDKGNGVFESAVATAIDEYTTRVFEEFKKQVIVPLEQRINQLELQNNQLQQQFGVNSVTGTSTKTKSKSKPKTIKDIIAELKKKKG